MDNNIIEYNKGREVIYSVFSKLFLNVLDNSMYKMLEDMLPFLESYKDDTDNALLLKGATGVIDYIKEYENNKNKEELILETARQYTRLFCLGNGVDLSESVYLSPEHLSEEDEAEIYNIYQSCNFNMDDTSNEPQDHLSYELMFMSYLSKGIANKYKENKDAAKIFMQIQKDFLEEHLLKWMDLLVERTINFEESSRLYLPALYFIKGFMQEDLEYLKEELQ